MTKQYQRQRWKCGEKEQYRAEMRPDGQIRKLHFYRHRQY